VRMRTKNQSAFGSFFKLRIEFIPLLPVGHFMELTKLVVPTFLIRNEAFIFEKDFMVLHLTAKTLSLQR
jgi:hypothetical protein